MSESGVVSALKRREFVSALATAVAAGSAGALLLIVLTRVSGLISHNDGLGFDGAYYATMVERQFVHGTPSMQLRPVVLIINQLFNDQVFRDVVTTFRAMNVAYAFVLAAILADLCRRYGASRAATATLIVNVFLCISTAKIFAFYPVLVDLGAYAFMAASVWAMVMGYRLPIVVFSVLAVLSREFGLAVVFFGVVRDLRMRRSIPVVAATYAPAVLAFFWIRQMLHGAVSTSETVPPVLTVVPLVAALLKNIVYWADPLYVLFWVYFAVTLFGGVSVLLVIAHRSWWTSLRQEPEWLAFCVPLMLIAVVGYADMWRYSAFLLPAVPALWAWSVSRVKPGLDPLLFTCVTLVTIATQRPWQRMDLDGYFRDWFPYYVVLEKGPEAGMSLWPVWTYYVGIAAVSLIVLGMVRRATLAVRADTSVAPATGA